MGAMLTFIVCLEAGDIMASLLKRGQTFQHALLLGPLLLSIHHVLQVLHLPLPGLLINTRHVKHGLQKVQGPSLWDVSWCGLALRR